MRASWPPWTSTGASGKRWQTTWARGELRTVDSALGGPQGWAEFARGRHVVQAGTDAELRGSIPL